MIYFTQDSSNLNIKIGYSGRDPEERRNEYQTGNSSPLIVLAVMPGTRVDEAALHRRFAHARVLNEWFRPIPAILALIRRAGEMAGREAATEEFEKRYDPEMEPRFAIYLAGAMRQRELKSGTPCWRYSIIGGNLVHKPADGAPPQRLPRLRSAVFGRNDYVGPYYLDLSGGLFCSEHVSGYTGGGGDEYGLWETILEANRAAIRNADFVFAWIDSPDCYTAIAEIGYANALGKTVYAATGFLGDCSRLLTALEMSTYIGDELENPVHALKYALFDHANRGQDVK